MASLVGGGGPQPGARILLLDPADRLLLLHGRDPHQPARTWWELPGGILEPGESPTAACRRELAEETGIQLPPEAVGRCVWIREARFVWDGCEQHRVDEIFLARAPVGLIRVAPARDQVEQTALGVERWWSLQELAAEASTERFLPQALPRLVAELLNNPPAEPVRLYEDLRDGRVQEVPGGSGRGTYGGPGGGQDSNR